MKCIKFLFSCLSVFPFILSAQIAVAPLDSVIEPGYNKKWMVFKAGTNINPLSFFNSYKNVLSLGADDEMRLQKTEADTEGFTHYRYRQYYSGYRIEGAEFILHAKNNQLTSANGDRITGLVKVPVKNVTADAALTTAKQHFPAPKYAWEVPEREQSRQEIFHDKKASYKPIPELVWTISGQTDATTGTLTYLLCYQFDIFTDKLDGKRIFIDAATGNVVKDYSLVPECTSTSGATNFYGNRNFNSKVIPYTNLYHLWDDCQPAFIHTRRYNGSELFEYQVVSNNWSAHTSPVTSHWGVKQAYNYFYNVHTRFGWNNNFGGVEVYQQTYYDNAGWSDGIMVVGEINNVSSVDDWNTLDIMAHEFAHGVTQNSADLVYEKEPGALNESFSDIFGVNCYANLFGLNGNTWLVGFDRKNPATNASLYLRNMANPNDKSDPDTYQGTNWVSTGGSNPGDYWGVHTNSGVQNFMYYLLVSGGSGTNDNGYNYSISGIGIEKARRIAYRALVYYLSTHSTYPDARSAWIQAANDLFGACSFESIQTGKAWAAVNLIPPLPNNAPLAVYCGTYSNANSSVINNSRLSLAFNCQLTVLSGAGVSFGGLSIRLNPGFRANSNSYFRAYTTDCNFTNL